MNKTINIKKLINKINQNEDVNNIILGFDIVLGTWDLYKTIKIYDNKKYIAYIQYQNNKIHSFELMRFNEYNYRFILD